MRILIDLQAYQGESGFRGIGRYSISFTKAILRNNLQHDIYILLNGAFVDSIERIKKELKDLMPKESIITFFPVTPASYINQNNYQRAKISELIREYVMSNIGPDIVHINSLFEGFADDVITSAKVLDKNTITSVTLYDLIPLVNADKYLINENYKNYYFNKIEYLKKMELLLAISNYSKNEAIRYLEIDKDKIFTIYGACDEKFRKIDITKEEKYDTLRKYGIRDGFILYVPGGFDIRKNIDGLVKAYSKLLSDLKNKYQLVIASKIDENNKAMLENLIKSLGIKPNVVITGYVPDEDLIKLYNLCDLFVFPSLHEGFGLPILEAMACGAPVIASNTTSIPEVVGREDALFNPYNIDSIAFKMKEVLTNEHFINELKEYSLKRVKSFSWDNTAKKAIESFEYIYDKIKKKTVNTVDSKKPKLAYISPLPPEKSGVSYYSKELLPYLSKYYDIEAIVDQDKVTDNWISQNIPIRNVDYFKQSYKSYDRILYHLGNSPFHKHMLFLLEKYPGVVVLHDFYISDLYWWMEFESSYNNFFTQELYYSHGYHGLKFLKENSLKETVFKYPLNASVLQNALGIITHSEFSKTLAGKFYSINNENWYIIKQLRKLKLHNDKNLSRKKLGIKNDDFIICSFGILGPTKLNHLLLEAFIASSLSSKNNIKLIFVGENPGGEDYYAKIVETINKFKLQDKVIITGLVDDQAYNNYLSLCDIAVQLRTLSIGEASVTVLDCLASGIPTIVNVHGTMADFSKDAVYMIEDEFKHEDLVRALEELYYNEEKRKILSLRAQDYIKEFHDPGKIANDYKNAIEHLYLKPSQNEFLEEILTSISDVSDKYLATISLELSKNISPKPRLKQLFVDVSEVSRHDLKTGIQRVVKAQLKYLLEKPPEEYRIEPVYLENIDGKWIYKYARKFTQKFLGINTTLEDEPIDIFEEDLFYAPDLHPTVYEAGNQGIYKYMRSKNVKIIFLVYDILPILRPDCFPEGAYETHSNWVKSIVSYADKLICISESVKYELKEYLEKINLLREDLQITHIHLGSDISSAKHSAGLNQEDLEILNIISQRPYFLMVSTVEPRKGHRQVLKAFERLWAKGYNFNLVFVGKKGWMMDDFMDYVEKHPEKNKRFFYLGHVSDDLLENLYKNAAATIIASEGEGFGLSIIESAYYKTPIIARDIPVFREVAQDGAYYFPNTKDEKTLANAILEWYNLYKENKHPRPDSIKWMSWQEHTEKLKEILLK
ncbi:glycosyltransferase [Hydrogenobaculum acidophilum]